MEAGFPEMCQSAIEAAIKDRRSSRPIGLVNALAGICAPYVKRTWRYRFNLLEKLRQWGQADVDASLQGLGRSGHC